MFGPGRSNFRSAVGPYHSFRSGQIDVGYQNSQIDTLLNFEF